MAGVTIASRPANTTSSLSGAIAIAPRAPRTTPIADLHGHPREDAAEHAHRRRTQGRANADLPPALRHGERHQRVDTGRREQQHRHQDARQRERDEADRERILAISLRARSNLAHPQRGIDGGEDLVRLPGEAFVHPGCRRSSQSHRQAHTRQLLGCDGIEHRRADDVGVDRIPPQILGNANDLVPGRRLSVRRWRHSACAGPPRTCRSGTAAQRSGRRSPGRCSHSRRAR